MSPLRAPVSILLLCPVLLCGACATAPQRAPKQRYVAALQKRYAGDAAGYYDDLIALAHESPHSRAGRRARAIVTSGGTLPELAVLAAVSSLLWGRGASGPESAGEDPRRQLEELARHRQSFRAQHQRECTTFAECGWQPPPDSPYLFYLSLDEVIGGGGASDPSLLRLRAESTFATMNVQPGPGESGSWVLAAGDPDQDGALDVWGLDERGYVVHLVPD